MYVLSSFGLGRGAKRACKTRSKAPTDSWKVRSWRSWPAVQMVQVALVSQCLLHTDILAAWEFAKTINPPVSRAAVQGRTNGGSRGKPARVHLSHVSTETESSKVAREGGGGVWPSAVLCCALLRTSHHRTRTFGSSQMTMSVNNTAGQQHYHERQSQPAHALTFARATPHHSNVSAAVAAVPTKA